MSDRVPSDHPSVTTLRAALARSGGTRRPCLRLPDDLALAEGDLIRLVLDGRSRHARVAADSAGLFVRGAYDNRRLARTTGEGDNRLVEWCREHDRDAGDAVELDEVEAGYLYGLRVPGLRAVYTVADRPSDSLASLAEKFSNSDPDHS